jgi:putative addiction module killer protein
VRAAIAQRIERLEKGIGDVAAVGDGVKELRIHLGAGWRVYFIEVGGAIILLLGGGTKNRQQADIDAARKTVREIVRRKQEGINKASSTNAASAAKPGRKKS